MARSPADPRKARRRRSPAAGLQAPEDRESARLITPPNAIKILAEVADTLAMDSVVERFEPESIDPELVAESTEPQFAPQRRSTPVAAPPPGQPSERSRRSTLQSPIPSLMAASMRVRRAGEGPDTGPVLTDGVPVHAEPQMTSKQGERSRALLLGGESDYVVEIESAKHEDAAPVADGDLADDTNHDP